MQPERGEGAEEGGGWGSRLPPGRASHRLSGTVQAAGPAQPGSCSCGSCITSLWLRGARPPGQGWILGGFSQASGCWIPARALILISVNLGKCWSLSVPGVSPSAHGALAPGAAKGLQTSCTGVQQPGGSRGSPLKSGPFCRVRTRRGARDGPADPAKPFRLAGQESAAARGTFPLSPPPLLPPPERAGGRVRPEGEMAVLHGWRELVSTRLAGTP